MPKRFFYSLIRAVASISIAAFAPSIFAQTPNLDPIPSYYQEPGLSPQRDYTNQHANETIDPFTGKLQLHYVDLFIPGNGGLDIKMQRSYSSGDGVLREPSPYGYGWTMGFGRVVRTARLGITLCETQRGSVDNPVMELPDGSRQILYTSSDQTHFISPNRWKAVCSGIGGMSVYSPDGTRYEMNHPGPIIGSDPNNRQQSWYPTRITDRNGNTLTLTHKGTAGTIGVDTVTASDGRVVTFGYDAGTGAIASVTDGTRTFTYTTTAGPGAGQFYLTKVTRPDTTTWLYEYNPFDLSAGAGSINKVTHPTGGSLSYTYSIMRFNQNLLPTSHVVTRKTGSLDASWDWTYTYTPASTPAPSGTTEWAVYCPAAELDVTVVSGPEGTTTYCHVGYNSANRTNGAGYLIGSLVEKRIGASADGPVIFTEGVSKRYQVLTTSQSMIRGDDGVILADSVLVPIALTKESNVYGQFYVTEYGGYDLYGNPGSVTETGTTSSGGSPDTRVTTLTYQIDPAKWIINTRKDEAVTVNGTAAGTITRQFDERMNLLNEVKFGVQNSWTYYSTGDRLTHTNAQGKTVTYSNYLRGIGQNESHPEGVLISRVIDGVGNVTSETDGEGATTGYGYDGLNRITSIRPARGNSVSVTRTPTTRTVLRGPNGEKTTYDAFGRAVQVQHLASLTPTFTRNFLYDPVGRQIFASDPNITAGKRTDYNALGHETAVKWPCQGYTGACETARYMGWNGKVRSVVNERGYETRYTYRGFGDPASLELVQITPPDASATVTIKRDGLGKPLEISQGGFTRTFAYDSATQFLISSSEPETGTTTYGRDAVGNMKSKTVGANPTVNYDYDDLNRLRTTTYPAGTPSVSRTYYRDGKLKSLDNGVARREYEYDLNKNLTKETLTVDGQAFVFSNAYDGNDVLSTLTYPSGKTVTYTPDAFGRPTKAWPYVTAVGYDANSGAMTSFTYANDVVANLTYNTRYLPKSLSFTANFSQAYSYGLTGNLLAVSDSIDNSYSRTMSYDSLERLTVVNGPWGNGNIQYDAVGNIRSQTFGSTNLDYQYDAVTNRVQAVSGSVARSYSYDGYGNVSGDGAKTYAYNDAQNLRCARCGQADEVLYRYDGEGIRVSAQPAGGLMTYFVQGMSGQLLMEQTGQTVKEFAYLKDRQIAVRTAQAGTGGGSVPSGGSTSFAVTLSASSSAPRVGETVTLSAGVTNSGTQAAASVALINSLPMGMAFVSASPACSAASGVVQCNLGDLAAGAQASVQIVARVQSVGTLVDFVTASSPTPIKAGAAPNYASVTLNTTADAGSAVPAVSLVTPADGAAFQDPASIALSATASDSDGSIQYVDFYNGTTLLGRARSAPYTFIWDKVAPGNYALSAKAVDSAGQASASNVANVSVSLGAGPGVSITSPAGGAVFRARSSGLTVSIPLAATAVPSSGTITRVEFFNGAKLIGTSRSAPYAYNWTGVGVGSYILSAKAYDSSGKATTSSSVPISVAYNQSPSIGLTAPTNGAQFGRSANIAIVADAVDFEGAIVKVDFFNRSTLLGTVTTPPYTYTWANAPVGTHVLAARVTDAEGVTAASQQVAITVIENAAPTVVLTAPISGSVLNAPALIGMTATAGDTDGTVSKVEFLNGTTVLGTAMAAPYSFSWSGVAAGNYTVSARATDNLGAVTASAPVSVTVNALPTVGITAPASGGTFTAPATVSVTANAADSDGSVSKVEFFNGASLIGSATTAPYAISWTNVGAGSYSLTAKATDNRGAVTTSTAVGITVSAANAAPSVSLTAPANGATYNAPASITLTANASDSDGTINKVEFYNGATLLGTDTTSPYSFSWTNVATGSYSLTAKATDNKGAATTSAPVAISVNALPNVSLTAPAAGATFTRPVTITISASASDSDGTISKVEFYRGTTLIGTDMTSPYSVTWTPSAAGTYSLTAKATDNRGGTKTSAARSITVR